MVAAASGPRRLHRLRQLLVGIAALACVGQVTDAAPRDPLGAQFQSPPVQFRPMPLYWLNGSLDAEVLKGQVAAMRNRCGFGGFAPLAMAGTRPTYLTDEYFARYRLLLEEARRLGVRVIFYDDVDFPTGSAGGRMRQLYPGDMAKNLRKVEREIAGPGEVTMDLPEGALMAAVAMETRSLKRVDLRRSIRAGRLGWQAPAGNWRVMLFTCVPEGAVVDYLDPRAVKRFLTLTYDQYASRFKPYFGSVIGLSFFDDVALVYTSGGRTWTTSFNDRFRRSRGYDPSLLYPALWYDIGPNTQSARAALFGFRAELMSEGFVRTVHDWCVAHGIRAMGHPAGNYNPQPVEVSGDNLLFYKHCDVPLVDSIHYYRHGRDGFKLPTSAAANFDRPLSAVEIYGNYPDATVDTAMLYRSAMELFVRGVNVILPHGTWYDPARMTIPPEISERNPRFGRDLPDYSRFASRCSLMLQGGRHVADIGMLYPVDSLEADYRFDVAGRQQPNWGYDAPPWADYLAISGALTGTVRRDFTFLHPSVVRERCCVAGPSLVLANRTNREEYRVLMLPGGPVISWPVLAKALRFYRSGGRVVATTQLPRHSTEFGHDADVRRAVVEMFGVDPTKSAEVAAPMRRVRIVARGSEVRTYIDGRLVDTTADSQLKRGRVGLREAETETAEIHDLVVRDGAGRELLRDGFAGSLDQWLDTGTVATGSGRLLVGNNTLMSSRDGSDWSDYSVEMSVAAGATPVGIVFRMVDRDNLYMWQFWPDAGRLVPHRRLAGQWSILKQVVVNEVGAGVRPYRTHRGPGGGRAYFAPIPSAETLQAILDDATPVPDVRLVAAGNLTAGGGMLSYIHKFKEGREIYLLANSTDSRVRCRADLRGRLRLQAWDPHTGRTAGVACRYRRASGGWVTSLPVDLLPVRCLFLVGRRAR